MAVAIPRTDHDAAGLRRAAARTKDADAARRRLALARVLEGRSRPEAAHRCGLDRQTLRDWVHRFTDEGRPGLSSRKAPGAKPRRSPDQPDEGAQRVRSGPDLAEPGGVRGRRADLSKGIEARFGVRWAERRVGALVRRLGFRPLSVRPPNPAQDPAALEAHNQPSPPGSRRPSPSPLVTRRSRSGGRRRPGLATRAR
jgi:transposase